MSQALKMSFLSAVIRYLLKQGFTLSQVVAIWNDVLEEKR
jgi:SOS response regulatory protein OraA/RecX